MKFPVQIYILVLANLSGGLAHAAESPDPFDTGALLPAKPALHAGNDQENPCASGQQPDHPLSLMEVVNLALCNNPQTRAAWANSLAQSANVGIGKSAYLPSAALAASASHTLSGSSTATNQRNIGVTISWLLYDFGARSANLENARQLLAAAIATQDSTVQTVFLAAIQSYYQVQANLAALDATTESEKVAKESLAAAEARYNAGTATPADKLQAQTAYSQATLNRITASGNLKTAQGSLSNTLGVDANHNIVLTPAGIAQMPPDFEGDVNALIEEARRQRPDLQAAAAQVKAAEASVDAARASGRPTLSLTGSANRYNDSGIDTHNSQIGIALNIPLFTGYATTYRVRSAEAQVDIKNAQYDQLHLQVALDVWTDYQRLTTASQSLRTSTDLLNSAEQSERVALGRYKAGVGSMLDLLNAQSALASARQQRIQSVFDWNISRAALAQAMGSLDVNLLQTIQDSGKTTSSDNHSGTTTPPEPSNTKAITPQDSNTNTHE